MKEISENSIIKIVHIPRNTLSRVNAEETPFLKLFTHTVCPLVIGQTLRYNTGLSKDDIQYLKNNNYHREKFDDDIYRRDIEHPTWDSQDLKVTLSSEPTFLYPGRLLDDFCQMEVSFCK